MKKQYIKPSSTMLDTTTTVSILAASPQNVNPGDGNGSSGITKDESTDGGWAASKGNSFGTWEADEEE